MSSANHPWTVASLIISPVFIVSNISWNGGSAWLAAPLMWYFQRKCTETKGGEWWWPCNSVAFRPVMVQWAFFFANCKVRLAWKPNRNTVLATQQVPTCNVGLDVRVVHHSETTELPINRSNLGIALGCAELGWVWRTGYCLPNKKLKPQRWLVTGNPWLASQLKHRKHMMKSRLEFLNCCVGAMGETNMFVSTLWTATPFLTCSLMSTPCTDRTSMLWIWNSETNSLWMCSLHQGSELQDQYFP